MNLYKVTSKFTNQIDYIRVEYVVGKSLEEIAIAYPKADQIELISDKVTILK